VDFTREPIIETIITPKEGCKLVVRSSKNSEQEEYFVESVEVVSFGYSFFFRSLERPKSFLVPASDYEILEVREARMVLKNVGLERSIKIGGGRETTPKPVKELLQEKVDSIEEIAAPVESAANQSEGQEDGRLEKKRDKRRHYRRRREREESASKESAASDIEKPRPQETKIELPMPELVQSIHSDPLGTSPVALSSILPPPPTLISETIARYKDNAMFRGAFFAKEQKDEEQSEGKETESKEAESKEADIELSEQAKEADIENEEPSLSAFVTNDEKEETFRNRSLEFDFDEDIHEIQPYIPTLEDPSSESEDSDSKDSVSNGNVPNP
jgi:hypothetical protein